MSSNYHTPIAFKAALTSANLNTPLGQLDQAITDILPVGVTDERIARWDTSTGGLQDSAIGIDDSGNIAGDGSLYLGSGSKNAAAIAQFDSTGAGILWPRMTTTQRNAISTPPEGLVIYNTTSGQHEFYDSSSWVAIGGPGALTLPDFGAGVVKTLASDVATAGSDRHLIIAAQSGTSDDLIEVSGLDVGDECVIRADSGDTITVKHNAGGATDKIILPGGADVDISGNDTMKLMKIAAGAVIAYKTSGGSSSGASIATLMHKEAQNTNGGTIASGANTLPITDETYDPDGIVSIASNQMLLASGSYALFAYHYMNNNNSGGDQYLYLYNATDAVDIDNQEGGVQVPNSQSSRLVIGYWYFTLATTKNIEIRAYSSVAWADSRGLGTAFNIAGREEIYGNYVLWKVA
jgi:hypothetical protein